MDKYLSIITNFGCHYTCPYCIVKNNNLNIPKSTISGLKNLQEEILKNNCNWVSLSGGGDPLVWGDKMIKHYETLGIDPKTKTLLFSDSLDFDAVKKISKYFEGRAKVAFGIGTYLSNDTPVGALNIVMKVTACNGSDVAKISDVEGKGMCKNPEYVKYLTRSINWRMNNN